MKTTTICSIKGGVGKSTIAIIMANFLAMCGKRVLYIDKDLQNSGTFYYYRDNYEITEKYNIAQALFKGDLKSNILRDNKVHLIASNFNIVKLRNIDVNTLKRLLPQIENDYDYCIIDTTPNYDNIVLNAINAGDIVLSPAYLNLLNYKSMIFYRERITVETDKINNWKIVINEYKEPRTENPDLESNQYLELFNETFDNILDTKIYDNGKLMDTIIDTKTIISKAQRKQKTYYNFVNLVKELFNIQIEPSNF